MFSEYRNITADPEVAAVIDRTMVALQVELEAILERRPELLNNPGGLGVAAFNSHVTAYEAGGFDDLDPMQQAEFLRVINVGAIFDYGPGPGATVLLGGARMVLTLPLDVSAIPLPGLVPFP